MREERTGHTAGEGPEGPQDAPESRGHPTPLGELAAIATRLAAKLDFTEGRVRALREHLEREDETDG